MEATGGISTLTGLNLLMYVLAIGFFGLFAVVITKMLRNTISLNDLISEPGSSGKASLSRFQLLIFTFVVAGVFLILSIENGQIIDIPNSVLGLLGISGGSYLVSKGISESKKKPPPDDGIPNLDAMRGRDV